MNENDLQAPHVLIQSEVPSAVDVQSDISVTEKDVCRKMPAATTRVSPVNTKIIISYW